MIKPSIQSPPPAKRFAFYWLPVLALAAAIYIQSGFPASQSLDSLPYGDKLAHIGVYGVMAFLFARAMNSHARWRGRRGPLWIIAFAATVLYGLSDEWHQSFVSVRTADAMDLLADGIGAVLGAWVYIRLVVAGER